MVNKKPAHKKSAHVSNGTVEELKIRQVTFSMGTEKGIHQKGEKISNEGEGIAFRLIS